MEDIFKTIAQEAFDSFRPEPADLFDLEANGNLVEHEFLSSDAAYAYIAALIAAGIAVTVIAVTVVGGIVKVVLKLG